MKRAEHKLCGLRGREILQRSSLRLIGVKSEAREGKAYFLLSIRRPGGAGLLLVFIHEGAQLS